jgi:YggT family protein
MQVHLVRGIAHSEAEVNIASAPTHRYSRRTLTFGEKIMFAIFWLAGELIHLMILAIIAAAVLSMLISFGVVNPRSQFVYTVGDFLNRVTAPILNPIRRHMPYLGNIDISPVIAILLLEALQYLLADIYGRLVMAGLTF